ncbi:sporulation integral membrane protein YlbJ [Hathewaya massiliensis]|uniref:sporulation integral membrane protein YlbJ n=1 Tax=Hathewaya massiliensis TaxID=1964382 RepID=UPI001157B985|nr:sporulation integral membrane protein YlbJ [Hathewaya massiliensis]
MKYFKKNKNKNNKVFIFILSILVLNIIIFPKPCMDGSIKGLKLFINSVFPCLFPFLVLCNLIIYFNGVEVYAKVLGPILCKPLRLPFSCSVVLILSFLCGYPMGAKYTADLYEKNIIDFATSERLLNIASNASPLFVMGTISITMLKSSFLGYILLISNYLSCLILGFLLRGKNKPNLKKSNNTIAVNNKTSFSKAFSHSIEDAINVCITVSGFVVFFSVIIEIIRSNTQSIASTKSNVLFSFLLGLLEITNGCHGVSSMNIPMSIKLSLISFLMSFSGICIILQVHSFIYKYNFSIKKYILRKFVQGIISALISIIIYLFSYNSISSFLNLNTYNKKFDFLNYLFLCGCILIVPMLLEKLKRLFNVF